jgi:hypothetical protein
MIEPNTYEYDQNPWREGERPTCRWVKLKEVMQGSVYECCRERLTWSRTMLIRKGKMYIKNKKGENTMNKEKLWKCISIAAVALSLLMTVGLILGRAAKANADGTAPSDQPNDGMAPLAMMDDSFWYQGLLTDGDGNPLANVKVNATFRIYDVASGGTALASAVVTVDTDANGLFNEEIDFNNPDLFNGQALYLGMRVDGETHEMTPRQCLRPVPYALSIRPGADIWATNSSGAYDPVLDIRNTYSTTADLDGLVVRVNGDGEAIEGYSAYGRGVYGSTGDDETLSDAGVYGYAENSAPGVIGRSSGTNWAYSYGGYFTSDNHIGLYAASGASSNYAAYFDGDGPSGPGIYVYGDVSTSGDITADGTKSAVVETEDYGTRKMYAVESPEVWFEDFGQGQLASGQTTVTIDPMFLSTIDTEAPYHVFVTLLGDCNGLYVTNKTATSFEVHELGNGTSNVAFDYRIVATRKGYQDVRMELFTENKEATDLALDSSPEAPEPEEP